MGVLHNNIEVDTQDCWAVGVNSVFRGYNSTVINKDTKIRYCESLGSAQSGWRCVTTVIRPDYDVNHLRWDITHDKYIGNQENTQPGTYMEVIDVNSDPTLYIKVEKYGRQWQENTIIRNNPFARGIYCDYANGSIKYEVSVPAIQGQSLPVSGYIKNETGSPFIGNIVYRLVQNGTTIAETTIDTATYTEDEWNFFSLTGLSFVNKSAMLEVEISDVGSKVIIADVLLPPSASEVSQANAVWQDAKALKVDTDLETIRRSLQIIEAFTA
jgi:hypothetical protein